MNPDHHDTLGKALNGHWIGVSSYGIDGDEAEVTFTDFDRMQDFAREHGLNVHRTMTSHEIREGRIGDLTVTAWARTR